MAGGAEWRGTRDCVCDNIVETVKVESNEQEQSLVVRRGEHVERHELQYNSEILEPKKHEMEQDKSKNCLCLLECAN
jgi:hypothetical protein